MLPQFLIKVNPVSDKQTYVLIQVSSTQITQIAFSFMQKEKESQD